MSVVSSMILKLHMGMVIFLNIICRHEFTVGFPFFYFCCTGMSKQNHWVLVPMCLANNQVHRTKKILILQGMTWVTDGGMLYRIVESELCN